jgi:hypothetical protein
MALFPELTIKRNGSTLLKIQPHHVDQQRCSMPPGVRVYRGGRDSSPPLRVEYKKTYVYIDISNDKQAPKSDTRTLFDLILAAQDQENILDFEIVYFKDNTNEKNDLCSYEFKGWITQFIIVDPVMDLWRYTNSTWDPTQEHLRGGSLVIGGTDYMVLLRLELTGAIDETNRGYLITK